jgi:hypothetical protein
LNVGFFGSQVDLDWIAIVQLGGIGSVSLSKKKGSGRFFRSGQILPPLRDWPGGGEYCLVVLFGVFFAFPLYCLNQHYLI